MNRSRLGLLATALLGLTIGTYLFWPRRSESPTTLWNGKPIPAEGLAINPEGETPGDPSEAERDFAKIYAAMVAFRQKTGRLPKLAELVPINGARESNLGLQMADFQSPDYANSDGHGKGREHSPDYAFNYIDKRPNGQKKPASPAPGERDVWMFSDLCQRRHQIVRPGGRSELKVTGCDVVLWSDGKIERIKPGDLLNVVDSPVSTTMYYPGQTGVPKGAVTQRETARRETYNHIEYED